MRRLLPCILAAVLLATSTPAHAYVDPTTGKPYATRITRSADIPDKNWLPGHRGVDLALGIGESVLAAGAGTVAFAGVVAGTPVVSIDHADGIRTTYQPVYTHVKTGDHVDEGDVIGRLAPAAGAEHNGLHWGARTGEDAYLNPLTLLDAPAIRLKPVDGPGRRRS
ncbi:M23 family metallopeptidase [Corynebacterium sanguinis]|uniref:Peptidase, M23 family n=1 Tax=Corynebacterium lipophiloflavum (strain ATCC 700352 / DSM 44291 / CCUG 37336 / JCM 10383 / DMMZ 1944) TaxID=525263 RepID=C0XSA9_CORLD|nr:MULTISPECIES: M23 family metallopeptidase [Corynebacterium]EEI16889.1 peptidase, M23 family [Corynebacterium lipophiloflavum DSM 44291]MCT1555486.1 M23 family metallopeptidase [Corynebacterium sanguinis]MCT1612966.1 M23 family metallopeptidase [Corynebacterium sanguinis]MCT1663152.1 M23 family metallopeptidase [Corynebacterium sanguinis]TVS25255.1 M23 family metallopeptidase [Corynebacterium sanguinis]